MAGQHRARPLAGETASSLDRAEPSLLGMSQNFVAIAQAPAGN